jgi:hypothetical protein
MKVFFKLMGFDGLEKTSLWADLSTEAGTGYPHNECPRDLFDCTDFPQQNKR